MTQRSAILQKKLHELESKLAALFRLPLTPQPPDPRLSDDIEQRFIFLKNLLSAEVASQPPNTDQLHEIGDKLTALEDAFRGWDKYRASVLVNDSNDQDDDMASVCSDCTNAVLPNDDDVKTKEDFGKKTLEKRLGGGEMEEESVWGKFVKYCGVFGCGVIVGGIFMVGFSTSPDHLVYEFEGVYLLPT